MSAAQPSEHDEHHEHREHSMCSLISRSVNEDVGGTAASVPCYVLVEVPLPWHSDALASKHAPQGLKEQLKRLAGEGHKFKTLVFMSDTHASPAGSCRLLFFRKPEAPLTRFARKEYIVPNEQAGDLIRAYLEDRSLDTYKAVEQLTEGIRDLFVCTHGSHDACCGKFGYGTYHELEERYASASDGKLRAWRVSHIGGHRLAPTLMDFPEGRYWGHLTSESLRQIVDRIGPTDTLKRHLRGWGALTSAEQLVERELFAQEGWAWTTYHRSAASLRLEDLGVEVRIDYYSEDRAVSGAYKAFVRETASIEVYGCEYDEPRAYPQFEVSGFQRIT